MVKKKKKKKKKKPENSKKFANLKRYKFCDIVIFGLYNRRHMENDKAGL